MDYKVYPFFKSHFSLGRSILTLGDPPAEPKKEEDKLKDEYLIHPDSIIDICKKNNMEKFFLIDDTISGFLEAKLNAEKADLQLIFGLRLTVLDDCTIKDEASKKKESKIVLIAKNAAGYNNLVKIASVAAKDGFYYIPRIDKIKLKSLASDNLVCLIPFYDSFIYNNNLKISQCCPDFLNVFNKEDVVFSTEDNDMPFDIPLVNCVEQYASGNNYKVIKSKSIYYKDRKDFLPYMTFRCIHNRTILSRPNLDHFCSKEFCFESWKEQNEGTK
jgi:DNA polymerase-3 subunit alpha